MSKKPFEVLDLSREIIQQSCCVMEIPAEILPPRFLLRRTPRRVQKPDPEDVWGNKLWIPKSLSNTGLVEHHVDWAFSGD